MRCGPFPVPMRVLVYPVMLNRAPSNGAASSTDWLRPQPQTLLTTAQLKVLIPRPSVTVTTELLSLGIERPNRSNPAAGLVPAGSVEEATPARWPSPSSPP